MLSPSVQKPVSLLKVLSANNSIDGCTSTNTSRRAPTSTMTTGSTSASTEQEDSPSSKTNTNQPHRAIGGKDHIQKEHSDRSFRSLDSTSIGNHRSCPSVVTGNNTKHLSTINILNQALEVASNSLNDYGYGDPADFQPQEPVDYGYGDPADSQPQEPVDYGYGDPMANQLQQPRRGGRARRRNSVTKFSVGKYFQMENSTG